MPKRLVSSCLFMLALLAACSGCVASYYPVAVSQEELRYSDPAVNGKLTLGVDHRTPLVGVPPFNINDLVVALGSSGIFREAGYLEDLRCKPDMIISDYKVTQPFEFLGEYDSCIELGKRMFVASATTVPFYCSIEYQITYKLRRASGEEIKTVKQNNLKGITIGWLASFMAASDRWELGMPDYEKYQMLFSKEVLREVIRETNSIASQLVTAAPVCAEGQNPTANKLQQF